MTVGEAIRSAVSRLAHIDTAQIDAEMLMAHALGVSRSDMLLRHRADPAPDSFAALIERRAVHEPVAHILGRQEFYGLDLLVTRDTLIPRGDSETLVEAARALMGASPPARILDLGTGTGALLLAALTVFPQAQGIGIDASPAAAMVAGANALRLGLDGRARFMERDWTGAGWAEGLGRFDLILCNPPYVEQDAALDPDVRDYEPASALFAGPEGLDDYRILIPQLRGLMAEGAVAIFEIGYQQADAVSAIAAAEGFAVSLRHDLAERPRALVLT